MTGVESAKPPLPKEIAGLINAMRKRYDDVLAEPVATALEQQAREIERLTKELSAEYQFQTLLDLRTALEQQAREIERLRCRPPGMDRVIEVFDSEATANQFLREDGEGGFAHGVYHMAKEIERLNVILANHGVTQLEKTEIMLAQKDRIAELEKAAKAPLLDETAGMIPSEHTPFPWRVYVQEIADKEQAKKELCDLVEGTPNFQMRLVYVTDDDWDLAVCITGCGEKSEANAKLIASIPSILATLHQQAREIERMARDKEQLLTIGASEIAKRNARIAELEADNEALSLGYRGSKSQNENRALFADYERQRVRIAELETALHCETGHKLVANLKAIDLEAELTKIACFIEPHWQGAGAKLQAEWMIRAIGRLNSERDELEAERDKLHERLEDNHEFHLVGGQMVRVDVRPGSIMDGIECHNETIRLQDDRLKKLLEERSKMVESLKWHQSQATERDVIQAATIERVLLLIPGGTHCDPQEIADSIRALGRHAENEEK